MSTVGPAFLVGAFQVFTECVIDSSQYDFLLNIDIRIQIRIYSYQKIT